MCRTGVGRTLLTVIVLKPNNNALRRIRIDPASITKSVGTLTQIVQFALSLVEQCDDLLTWPAF